MPQIERGPPAENDLILIAEYISRVNPAAAFDWIDQIERTLDLLASQPNMGESIARVRPGLRRISHGIT